MAGQPVGVMADGPLNPGVTYERNIATSNTPPYTDFGSVTYDPDDDNFVEVSDQADDIQTGTGPDTNIFTKGSVNDTMTDFDLVDPDEDGFYADQLDVPALTSVGPSQMSSNGQRCSAGIPSFTAGTMLLTPSGEVPVETPKPGACRTGSALSCAAQRRRLRRHRPAVCPCPRPARASFVPRLSGGISPLCPFPLPNGCRKPPPNSGGPPIVCKNQPSHPS